LTRFGWTIQNPEISSCIAKIRLPVAHKANTSVETNKPLIFTQGGFVGGDTIKKESTV
jgi:hypothetical protein